MKSALPLAAAIHLLSALSAAAPAQTLPGDAREGHALAEKVCSTCHRIEKGEHGAVPGGAPTFQDVADDPAVTETALLVFFRNPHADMPDLVLSPAETDDAIAYILGLR